MLWPKKNSYKEFDNEKKFLRLENSPPPPPHNFSNGPSLITPKAHFLILRCLNGRKVACILSKEITVMPVIEVRESQMSIMTITRKVCHSCAARNCLDRNLISQPLRRIGNSSEKHIRHCQGYNQVHGTSAKITVLYKNSH